MSPIDLEQSRAESKKTKNKSNNTTKERAQLFKAFNLPNIIKKIIITTTMLIMKKKKKTKAVTMDLYSRETFLNKISSLFFIVFVSLILIEIDMTRLRN